MSSAIPLYKNFGVMFSLSLLFSASLVLMPDQYLVYFVGACLLLVLLLSSLVKPTMLLYFIIITSATATVLREIGDTKFTISGLRWVFIALSCTLVLLINIRSLKIPKFFLPFGLFCGLTLFRFFLTPLGIVGLKDILFYTLPPLIGFFTYFVIQQNSTTTPEKVEKVLLYSAFLPLFLYAIFLPTELVEMTDSGPRGIINPRPVAVLLVIMLTLSVSNWRYGETGSGKKKWLLLTLLLFGSILFTLSRMASLLALLVMGLSRMNPMKLRTLFVGILLGMALFILLVIYVPEFQARFFHRSPEDLSTAFKYLNMMGREIMWPATFLSALKNPLIGNGPGSARLLVATLFPSDEVEEYHPHNEYLQVFHDMGIIGILFLIIAWLPLLIKVWRGWRQTQNSRNKKMAKWYMSATLSIIVILLNSLVDNTLHYTPVLSAVFYMVAIIYFYEDKLRQVQNYNS